MAKKRTKEAEANNFVSFNNISFDSSLKKRSVGGGVYLLVLFLGILVGIGSILYFFNQRVDLTGYAVKDSTLTLSVNSYINADSVIVFKTETQEIEKKVSELNLELVNGSYYVDTLSFDINELGFDLEKEDTITASLIDNGNTIAESERTYSKEKKKEEVIEENETEETTPELNETTESINETKEGTPSNETQEETSVENETQEVIQIPESNETELPIENKTEETVQNETTEQPVQEENKTEVQIPELNESISIPIANRTPEQNLTANETITIPITNETASNITLQNVTTVINKSEQTVQLRAEINKPVKWKKTIKLENKSNLTVEIPKESNNINVIKKENGKSIDLDENNLKIERDGKIEEALSTDLLTGNAIGSSESNWIRALTTWIKDI